MPELVLSALLNLRQPLNDIGGQKLFEKTGERKRFVVFSIETPQGFDVNGKLGEQLKSLAEKYANALGARPEFTRIHVL
jgi:hypothetical protein